MAWNRRKMVFGLAFASLASAAILSWAPYANAQQATASGQVRRVDAPAGKVTIKHGKITELKLPAMTLVYRAQPDLLQEIQPGDQVTFTVIRENGDYIIIQISN